MSTPYAFGILLSSLKIDRETQLWLSQGRKEVVVNITKTKLQGLIREEIKKFHRQWLHPIVPLHIFKGGVRPCRMSKGAIGYDVYCRCIVSPFEMDPDRPHLRKTLFDFSNRAPDVSVVGNVELRVCNEEWKRRRWVYRLDPGEMVLCGIGFAVAMPFPLCYLTLCRSGIASKYNIVVANGPGTIDPDYRGEAGIILFNCGKKPFYVYRRMRIAQVRFDWAITPRFRATKIYKELGTTERGAGGFGWTGF